MLKVMPFPNFGISSENHDRFTHNIFM